MHTLHDFGFSGNGWKVRRTLRLLSIPHRWIEVDILRGETRSEAFLAKNPAGEIPVLELPDGTCLAESHAILLYLADGTPWLPDEPLLRARVAQWMCFEQTHIDGVISRARFRRAYPHILPTTAADLARWAREGRAALAVLDRQLAGTPWLAGAHPTIADIAVSAYVQVSPEADVPLSDAPHVSAWLDRVAALPGHIPLDERPPATWLPDAPPPPARIEVRRGEIYWLHAPRSPDTPSVAHPHVVVQDDVLNHSRLDTVVVCALTSNLSRANEPGNVLLDPGEGDLARQSVVVASQVSSVPRHRLGPRIGALSDRRVDQILAGLGFLQRSGFSR